MVCICGHGKSSHQIVYQEGHQLCSGKRYFNDGKLIIEECECTKYRKKEVVPKPIAYKIANPEYPTTFNRFGIFIGDNEVGWVRHAPEYQPIAFIYDQEHRIDKQQLAKAFKRMWPKSDGTYFLVTEIVERKKTVKLPPICEHLKGEKQ